MKLTPQLLKEIRLNDLNMGLGEMAKALGYSKPRLDSIERLGRPIPKDIVKKLKKILKNKLEELQKRVDTSFM